MRFAAVVCALLIVLAGCSSVIDTSTPSPTTTESEATPTPSPTTTEPKATSTPPDSVSVVGGELPIDPTPVYARVLNMTDQRLEEPAVYIESPNGSSPTILDRRQSSFRTALGFVPPDRLNGSGGLQLEAYAPSHGRSVHLYEAVTRNATVTETTLAHEFVHTVQFRTGWAGEMWDNQPRVNYELTQDSRQAYHLLQEGSAIYVEYRYEQRFVSDSASPPPWRSGAYENASAYVRWNLARYTLGAEYVAEEIDSPAEIESLYTDPPTSTEQILHHTDDPIEPLSVVHNDSGNWTMTEKTAMGELFLRIALRTELNSSTAVDAAHGWGNDRRIDYERGSATGTAWILRWDDTENATEFEDAFRQYLDAKAARESAIWYGNDVNATYRMQRPGDRHVVVYIGNESFVRNANTTLPSDAPTDGPVTVEIQNDSAS